MRYSKSSFTREVDSNKCLHEEKRTQINDKFTPQGTRRRKKTKLKISRSKKVKSE